MSGAEIKIARTARAGHIHLNRPGVLNALTAGMVHTMALALAEWREDPSVAIVVIDAEPGRAFCAGGDIDALYRSGMAGDVSGPRSFFRAEYRLNATIAEYPKPIVVLVDGIVMGGGAGLAMHASHRVFSENALFAMPECAIGMIPDVGGSLRLAQAPGAVGEYLALTGARIGVADCLFAGLADRFVPSQDFDALLAALLGEGSTDPIERLCKTPPGSALADLQPAIDAVFAGTSVAVAVNRLSASAQSWAVQAKAAIERGAPLALILALLTVRAARRHANLRLALRDEYRVAARATTTGEFLEGVRAQIVDKDRNPRWCYPHLATVPAELVEGMLEPAPDGDLTFLDRPAGRLNGVGG